MPAIRGVDGCSAGWLSLSEHLGTADVVGEVHENAASLFRGDEHVVTAIDIPIGLSTLGTRACDGEARRILGPRSSSVFPAPVRAAIAAASYEAACDASAAACGKRLSKQTFAILPKIREVDDLIRGSSELLQKVFEVHPEVCFYYMNERRPMSYRKKSGFGFAERYRRLEETFAGAAVRLRSALPVADVADDDILDALAALWTARRIHAGSAVRLPAAGEERDEYGLPMQMLA